MFNIFTHLEKKAALEKYADSLNKIVHDHVEQYPNISPREILLRHASECDLEKDGEGNQQAKRKRATDDATSKQMAKRQKSTPLIERDQNVHDDAGKRKAAAQAQKMAVKTREVSSVTAMQEMQTSMTVSRNFQNSFPSTTQASTQQQAK